MFSRCLFLLVIVFGFVHAQAQEPDVEAASIEVIAAINAYRVALGLHPLTVNPTLTEMARVQAEYIASLNFEPPNDDFHIDDRGAYPRQRALRFGWPTYGTNTAQIEVSENAGLGSLEYVMDFWLNSTVHRTTMENTIYREIGVALIPHRFGFLYMIVFGARPNVLPVPVNPATCQLYIPNEYHTGGNGDWLRSVQTVQLISGDGAPLTNPAPWQPLLTAPPQSDFTVIFTGERYQVQQPVNLQRNQVILPETLNIGQVACGATATAQPSPPTFASEVNTVVGTNLYPQNQPDVYPEVPAVLGKAFVDGGVNLQCREYPTSTSYSLALIPSNTELLIVGLPAPRDEVDGFPGAMQIAVPDFTSITQLDIGIDNLNMGNIDVKDLWLNVEWWQPNGTRMECWVNAYYVSLFYKGSNVDDIFAYLQLVDRGILRLIPYNYPGGKID